jgi:C-terminal processing protease CtpA/Prc
MLLRLSTQLHKLLAIAVCVSMAGIANSPTGQVDSSFAQDFDAFCQFVAEKYAYFDVKKTRWDRVCAAYRARAAEAADKSALISVLESALGELYDQHAHLGTSSRTSPRLIPTGADVWAAWQGDAAMIVEVRAESAAARAGLRVGMQVLTIDDQPIAAAAHDREPRFLTEQDDEAHSWALQSVLAGRQNDQPIRLSVLLGRRAKTIEYVPSISRAPNLLSFRRLDGDLGYIKFNNSLGDTLTVKAFDEALDQLKDSKGLILDLRDTPSGGNTLVARGIMGRLVQAGFLYQIHELVAEARATGIRRRWAEYVMPRGQPYVAPVVVLVGRWTGSMGEGLAIGLDAVRGAPIVGTPMARLLGALGEMTLPASGIVVRIPTEKLYHINGTPREAFAPCPALEDVGPLGARDKTLQTGIVILTMTTDATPNLSLQRTQSGCAGLVR